MAPDLDRLHRRYAKTHDPRDLESLVIGYRGLARSLAARYRCPTLSREDLEQVAHVGLVKALRRFDPARGCAFTTYAVPTMLGELRQFCRQALWPVHVPRSVQDRVAAVRRAARDAAAASGQAPTVRELARRLKCTDEEILDALQADRSVAVRSLDADVEEHPGGAVGLDASLAVDDHGYEAVEDRHALESALRCLTDTERRLVHLRFAEDLSHREIAGCLGMSSSQVGRVLEATIGRLSAETAPSHPRRIPRRRARRGRAAAPSTGWIGA